jgi:hypothetical protein
MTELIGRLEITVRAEINLTFSCRRFGAETWEQALANGIEKALFNSERHGKSSPQTILCGGKFFESHEMSTARTGLPSAPLIFSGRATRS